MKYLRMRNSGEPWRKLKNNSKMKKHLIFFILFLIGCGVSSAENADIAHYNIYPQNPSDPQIERGQSNYIFDSVGSIMSIPQKVILLNPNIDSHFVSSNTEQYLKDFIRDNSGEMKDVNRLCENFFF